MVLGDEEERMIEGYVEGGEMLVLWEEGSMRGWCVVRGEGEDVFEIKKIGVYGELEGGG